MSIGRVKCYNKLKGFGFIAPVVGGSDLFVRESDIKSHGNATLKVKQKVRFEIGHGKNGPTAVNVMPA